VQRGKRFNSRSRRTAKVVLTKRVFCHFFAFQSRFERFFADEIHPGISPKNTKAPHKHRAKRVKDRINRKSIFAETEELVEAAGVEPASASEVSQETTCLFLFKCAGINRHLHLSGLERTRNPID